MSGRIQVNRVKVNSLVLLNVIKHCKSTTRLDGQHGQLLGIYFSKDGTLEISNSYPVPEKTKDKSYSEKISKKHEEVQYDVNQVGWYFVSAEDKHHDIDAIKLLFEYEQKWPYSVFLVYDVEDAKRGAKCPFKAYQLTSTMKQMLKFLEMERTPRTEKL